jgi:4-hydroxybenzoate polyprenyltransferase
MLRDLARAAHGGPTVVVTAVTALLAVGVGAPAASIVLLTLGMFAGQLSVGWSNDWIDAPRDRASGRTDKPLATGALSAVLVRNAAFAALLVGLALPLVASVPAGLLHVVFVASAWSYNLGLKSTWASVVPYIVSFGSLPALATLLRTPPALPPWWAWCAGAALGIAAHFANVLPDLADDRATGVRGLPHRMSRAAVALVPVIVLLLATAAVLVGAGWPRSALGIVPAALVLPTAAVALVTGLLGRRAAFLAVMVTALELTVLLLDRSGSLIGAR